MRHASMQGPNATRGAGGAESARARARCVNMCSTTQRVQETLCARSTFQRSRPIRRASLCQDKTRAHRGHARSRGKMTLTSATSMPVLPDEHRRSQLRWKRAGMLVKSIAAMANRLQRSSALGGGGIGPLLAQSGHTNHGLYLARLRRGVRIINVLHSGDVRQQALVNRALAENRHAIESGLVITEAASEEALEDIPMWMQGDASLATSEKLGQRQRLRYDRRVNEMLHVFWEAALRSAKPIHAGGGDMHAPGLDRAGHAMMLKRLYRVMIKDFNEAECSRSIQDDWLSDAKGETLLHRRAFGDAFFELADTVCTCNDPNHGAEPYRVLRLLFCMPCAHPVDRWNLSLRVHPVLEEAARSSDDPSTNLHCRRRAIGLREHLEERRRLWCVCCVHIE